MFRIVVLFCAAILCVAGPARADRALTLEEATAIAVVHHPALAAARAEIEAARALQQQAARRPYPEMEAGVGVKDAGVESGYAVETAVLFPIERAGKREARIRLAETEIEATEANLAEFQRDLEFQVRTLAYEWRSASADAEIAGEIAERSRTMIEWLKQRPVAGPAMLLELQVIEAQLVEFQKSAREFGAQRDIARRSLNILMGRAPDAPIHITAPLAPPTATYALDDLMGRLEGNPGLIKRLADAKRAAQEAEAARWENRPDYRVGPYLSREDAGAAETTWGLAVSLPLAWRNRNRGAEAAASAKRAAAEAQYAADLLAARSEIARIHRLYEAALEQVHAIPAERVRTFQDAADLADRQYRLGAIPVQLFLDMQREFLAVQILRHNALLEALKGEAALIRMVGETKGRAP